MIREERENNKTMGSYEDNLDTRVFFTHKCWRWKGAQPWAEQKNLPEIILNGKTVYERLEAIDQLQSEEVRADLACRVIAFEEIRRLISGIRNQSVLIFLAVREKHSVPVRLYALDYINEPETLRIIAHTDCIPVRSHAFERLVSIAETPERLLILANDNSLPVYHRMMAALRLVEGSDISELEGTDIYWKSNVVRFVIDQKKLDADGEK